MTQEITKIGIMKIILLALTIITLKNNLDFHRNTNRISNGDINDNEIINSRTRENYQIEM